MEFHSDEFAVVTCEDDAGILKIDWSEKTAAMTADDFKAALVCIAEGVEAHGTPNILVDARRFRFHLDGAGLKPALPAAAGAAPMAPRRIERHQAVEYACHR